MTARDGVRAFLFVGKALGQLTADDVELAIEIARVKNPSSAFSRAAHGWRLRHPGTLGETGFAKGVRWLAMIRRDEGQTAFLAVCEELRQTP